MQKIDQFGRRTLEAVEMPATVELNHKVAVACLSGDPVGAVQFAVRDHEDTPAFGTRKAKSQRCRHDPRRLKRTDHCAPALIATCAANPLEKPHHAPALMCLNIASRPAGSWPYHSRPANSRKKRGGQHRRAFARPARAGVQASRSQPLMALLSMNSSRPMTPPSRARPDALTPPKADPAPREMPFISTMPDRNCLATRLRFAPS